MNTADRSRTLQKGLLLTIIISISGIWAAPDASVQNRLSGTYTEQLLTTIILPVDKWHPFPTYEEREVWERIDKNIREDYLLAGESALKKEWPHLPASVYLDYIRNGNRSRYEQKESARKRILLDLVMAELVEGRGRFLDAIVDAVWSVCEQSTWTLPAHVKSGLPDVTNPVVALRTGETGAMLSWIYYLFKKKFEMISPRINQRIIGEIDRRIIEPSFSRDDFWWLGFDGSRVVNNWNPWCNSNWLTCLLVTVPDTPRKYQSIYKSLRSLDQFLDSRPPDGGCDEGPSYWNHAAGTLFIALEMLYGASCGRIDIFQDPLIRNLGEYLPKVHINGPYFVNFADASAKISVAASMLTRYGRAVQSERMLALAREAAQEDFNINEEQESNLYRRLKALFQVKTDRVELNDPDLSLDAYFPDTQVVTSRSALQKEKGIFLAAKGGHNGESHNHNDVGNFIIYKNGQPRIIDIGVETYTRKTFSKDRYEIWTMNSDYHNLPSVNGFRQKNGRDYRARNVSFKRRNDGVEFSMDIDDAYPKEANIKSLKRTIIFTRAKSVTLIDQYALNSYDNPYILHLISPERPQIESDSTLLIGAGKENALNLSFPEQKFRYEVEPIKLKDERLKRVWGENLYRIKLEVKSDKPEDTYRIVFE